MAAAAAVAPRLAGQLAVITGGGSGIGRAIAQRFAAEGASCVVVGRNTEKLRETVHSLQRPLEHSLCTGDVTQPDLWSKLSLNFRDMAILVNAAGISQNQLLVRSKPEALDSIIDTNLKGTMLGCKAAAAAMIKYRRGCIINISSILGVKGGKGASVYAASKAGVLGLTRSLAFELGGANIRVNAILPGFISGTGMTPQIGEQVSSIPLRRMGLPEEVADAAAFLAANEYVSNCMLNIDGGLSAL